MLWILSVSKISQKSLDSVGFRLTGIKRIVYVFARQEKRSRKGWCFPASSFSISAAGPTPRGVGLVGRFVLLDDLRLDAASGVHLDAVLSCPPAHRLGVDTTRTGLAKRRGLPASTATGYLAAGVPEAFKGFTKFISVTIIQVNLIFGAVKSE
jgi:hypothetical protein